MEKKNLLMASEFVRGYPAKATAAANRPENAWATRVRLSSENIQRENCFQG